MLHNAEILLPKHHKLQAVEPYKTATQMLDPPHTEQDTTSSKAGAGKQWNHTRQQHKQTPTGEREHTGLLDDEPKKTNAR